MTFAVHLYLFLPQILSLRTAIYVIKKRKTAAFQAPNPRFKGRGLVSGNVYDDVGEGVFEG